MRASRVLQMIDVHCEGEIGRVLVSGVLGLPGASMLEKMNYLNEVDDSLRRFCVFEPRGKSQATVNLLLPPCNPEADAGFIVMQPDRAHAMSGSNCICVVTALLETGIIAMTEPKTVVKLDTPAGLVTAMAECRDGKCVRVTLDMVPSFVERLDVVLDVPQLGRVKMDIAFGGVFYALVDADHLNIEIKHENARRLVDIASLIKRAVDENVQVVHPELPSVSGISYVMFCAGTTGHPGVLRGSTIVAPGRCDRSPCGTGTSSRLAVLHARGELSVGTRVTSTSIINGEFQAEIRGLTTVAGRPAILPRISGRAWIYGRSEMLLDPSDPFPLGFALSDTWGPDVDRL